nr:MAG TPA: hypothetical protein [Caudoviricetes sp.]
MRHAFEKRRFLRVEGIALLVHVRRLQILLLV